MSTDVNGNSMGMHGGRVNMEAEERQQPERQRVWKNKRRASLYNLQDSKIGFMYRKTLDDKPSDEQQTDQLQQSPPPAAALPAPTPHNVLMANQSISSSVMITGAENIKREAIIQGDCVVFVQSLKTDLEGSIIKGKENEFSQVMDSLLDELTDSGLYKAALEQPEVLPMEESSASIVRIKQLIQKFDLEIEEWKALLESKRNEKAHVEPILDQHQLEALLSDEELQMLRQPLVNWQYCEEKERELNQQAHVLASPEERNQRTNASLDAELQRISNQSSMIMKQVSKEQQQYATILQPEDTPRTLVQSLKRTLD